MRSTRIASGAAAVAFAATAVVAVILSEGKSLHASLDSDHAGGSRHAGVSAGRGAGTPGAAGVPRCAASRLRISVRDGPGAARIVAEFTNVSPAACSLRGYPSVSAYGAGGKALGRPAGDEPASGSAAGQPAPGVVVLRPGATAQAAVDVSVAALGAQSCHPVAAAGLRIAPPGGPSGRSVPSPLTACSAAGQGAPVFLRVPSVEAASATG
jgi:uncharacterized protein DUF4232